MSREPKSFLELAGFLTPEDVKINQQQERGGLEASMNIGELFSKGNDERCKFKIGDNVEKATYELGDIHNIGHKGIVEGNYFLPLDNTSVYLVQFEGDEHICFTIEYKIRKQ